VQNNQQISSSVLWETAKIFCALSTLLRAGHSLGGCFEALETDAEAFSGAIAKSTKELLIFVQSQSGAAPTNEWASDVFLPSSKLHFSIGWATGLLDNHLLCAVDLIHAHLALRSEASAQKQSALDYYFSRVFASYLPLQKKIEVLDIETPIFSSQQCVSKSFEALSGLDESLSFIKKSLASAIVVEAYQRMLASGEVNEFEALSMSLYKEVLWPTAPEAIGQLEQQKIELYRTLSSSLKSGVGLSESLKNATASIANADLSQCWERVFGEISSTGRIDMKDPLLSSIERAMIQSGLDSGTLDLAFSNLAQWIESPYRLEPK
jgi:hypothetical protein